MSHRETAGPTGAHPPSAGDTQSSGTRLAPPVFCLAAPPPRRRPPLRGPRCVRIARRRAPTRTDTAQWAGHHHPGISLQCTATHRMRFAAVPQRSTPQRSDPQAPPVLWAAWATARLHRRRCCLGGQGRLMCDHQRTSCVRPHDGPHPHCTGSGPPVTPVPIRYRWRGKGGHMDGHVLGGDSEQPRAAVTAARSGSSSPHPVAVGRATGWPRWAAASAP